MKPRMKRFLMTAMALTALGCGYAMAQAAKPVADVNQLMRALFFPNSNVVFLTQRMNPQEIKQASEPSAATDPLMSVFNGWGAVENSALTISDSAFQRTREDLSGPAVAQQLEDRLLQLHDDRDRAEQDQPHD